MSLNIGIAGFGKAGEIFHSPFINSVPEIKLYSVLERHKEKSKSLFPWVKVYKDYDKFLEDDQLDIVVVATPNDLHFYMAKQALLAGKHVVIDKPITVTSSEGEELIKISRDKKLVLTVYHNRRLDGTFQLVKKVIAQKKIGDVEKLEICFDRFRPEINSDSWRETNKPGSGILYDLGSHLIDQVLHLFGKPHNIEGVVRSEREGAIADDFFRIRFFYNSGTEVVITAGMLVKEKTPHYLLSATRGTMIIEDLDPQEAALKAGLIPGDAEWPTEISAEIRTGSEKETITAVAGNYSAFYRNLYLAINHHEPLLIKPDEALEVIRVIEKLKV